MASTRNHLEGTIVELEFGSVVARVVVQAGENLIESIITKGSARQMRLKVGDTVTAVLKSSEVLLQKETAKPAIEPAPENPSAGEGRSRSA